MNLGQDFRLGIRVLRRSPGTTLVIILALALGIGVNASCFISVNALILHPLPYPNLARIMTVWETIPKMRSERDAASPANYFDWSRRSGSFDQTAAFRAWDVSLTGAGDPERVRAYSVSPAFFSLLGLQPALGRTFASDEAEPGRSQGAVVVSQGFWKLRMGASPDAVGSTLRLGGAPYIVVGVMPEEFNYPLAADLWTPLELTPAEQNDRVNHNLQVLGRLKPGVTLAQARAEMDTISRRLAQEHPATNENREAAVIPMRELANNVTDRFVLTLFCTATFVLLLACANVANLQLARATGRQREMAVRTALGAGRWQIARQLVTESVITALAGGAVGLALADWNLSLTRLGISPEIARYVAGIRMLRVDWPVVFFTLAISLIAGVLCATPALYQILKTQAGWDLNEALKEGGRTATPGRGRNRLNTGLAVGEVALALVLLIGAGLMVQAFQRLLTLKTGFNPKNLLTLQTALPVSQYGSPLAIRTFYKRVLAGVETIPGVQAVGAGTELGMATGLSIEGRPESRPGEPRPAIHAVSEHYFQAMELPILRGRAISPQDGPDAPAAVVISDSVARHYWPDSDPIGGRIKLGDSSSSWLTIVGVSGDVTHWFLGDPMPAAYIPYAQSPQAAMTILVRSGRDPMALVGSIRGKVRDLDANLPIFDIKTMEKNIADQLGGVRISAFSMGTYAAIALLLAVTGIYALISYTVAQRTHEIGVRMALGADRRHVIGMTLGQAMRIAGIGLSIGIPLAMGLTWLMMSLLYNVVAVNALTFGGLTVLLAASALLAGYVPARRAARIDPMTALHHE